MRRGLIAVGGDTGDFAGVSLIAGSVFVFGQPGVRPGAGMKRGTHRRSSAPATPLLPTFRFDCVYRPVFLRLYLRQLRAPGLRLPATRILETPCGATAATSSRSARARCF